MYIMVLILQYCLWYEVWYCLWYDQTQKAAMKKVKQNLPKDGSYKMLLNGNLPIIIIFYFIHICFTQIASNELATIYTNSVGTGIHS